MKSELPKLLRENLAKAGRIRAAQITSEQRRQYGRKAWATRVARARRLEAITQADVGKEPE